MQTASVSFNYYQVFRYPSSNLPKYLTDEASILSYPLIIYINKIEHRAAVEKYVNGREDRVLSHANIPLLTELQETGQQQ